MKRNLKISFKEIYFKLVRINDSPAKIAGGAAIGAFLGVFPTPFIAIILALVLASLFRVNRASAVIGTVIMNPLTAPFFWGLSCYIGAKILGGESKMVLENVKSGNIFRVIEHGTIVYLAGNLVVSIVVAGLVYIIVLLIIKCKKIYND